MKIREVITEDVDMGWWQDIDADYNPEALKQIRKQIDRREVLDKGDGTPVFTKPVRSSEKRFSNAPIDDAAQTKLHQVMLKFALAQNIFRPNTLKHLLLCLSQDRLNCQGN